VVRFASFFDYPFDFFLFISKGDIKFGVFENQVMKECFAIGVDLPLDERKTLAEFICNISIPN
jgi:hypothetical protein